jgi:hypothetical protein
MIRENASQGYIEEYFIINSISSTSRIKVIKSNYEKDIVPLVDSFFEYESALNTNDVDALNCFFLCQEIAVRYGANESLYGHDSISLFRQSRHPNDAQRILLRNRFILYSDSVGIVTTEFIRHKSNGRQTQVWIRDTKNWKILSAHISFV